MTVSIKNLPKVYGEEIELLPQDLYIPPDALEVYLDSFEGPLDLLIYLIRKNNIDILDIPMANLTLQYIKYIEKMKSIKLELAADYLLMSAMLIEIKSRMLLPKTSIEDEEEDPRSELVKKLIEYELMKDAAENLNQMPQVGKDIMIAQSYFERVTEIEYPDISIDELFEAWKNVLKRAKQFEQHQISKSELSVREYMTIIIRKLNEKDFLEFSTFFNSEKDTIPKLVVCFLAILELTKEGLIKINQQSSSSAIYLQLGDS
jgi:segregation and condensation protein A